MATTRQHTNQVQTPETATVIGPGIRISGRVSGAEDLHVEGRIDGAVNLSETLYIAPAGIVAAEVEAHAVVVAGVLVGNVTARDCVTLHAGAKLVGDIHAPRIVIADGAAFRGNIRMGGEVPPPRAEQRQAARGRPGGASRFGRPAARPAAQTPARVEPPRARASEARSEAPRRDEARQEDDVTVVVRHAAVADESERRTRRPTPVAEPARTPEPPRAPPVGAREPGAKAPPPAAAEKKKLPPRARIPKPGKRRVHRR